MSWGSKKRGERGNGRKKKGEWKDKKMRSAVQGCADHGKNLEQVYGWCT